MLFGKAIDEFLDTHGFRYGDVCLPGVKANMGRMFFNVRFLPKADMRGFRLLPHKPAPGRLGINHELRTTTIRRGRALAVSETLASSSSLSTLPLARSIK
jgi:hypothetical protein